MSDFEHFGKGHPYLPSGWGPQARADIPKTAPQLPDVNPAAGLTARLAELFAGTGAAQTRDLVNGGGGMGRPGRDGRDGARGSDGLDGLNGRVSVIESRLAAASISASCNGDGTITVTLTI